MTGAYGCPDPAHQGGQPSAVRRRRTRRPRAMWSDSSRSRRIRPRDLALVGVYMFGRAIHEAVRAIEPSLARRAGDHRCDPMADREREVGPVTSGDRLLEGHRSTRGHARVQPQGPRGHRDRHPRTRSTRTAGSSAGWSSRRAPSLAARPFVDRPSSAETPQVVDSYVGPFTSIYHSCTVQDTEIEHSIVLERCVIRGVESHRGLLDR